jgi:Domain of unknown function (DUF4386)
MTEQRLARIAGLFYLANIAIGMTAVVWQQQGRTAAADAMTVAGAAEYAIVVLLLGRLFEPAGRALSWGVAALGLLCCAVSATVPLHLWSPPFNIVAVFGPYCIALGTVVARSGLLPRVIGWLLVVGGLSWLTFFLPAFSHRIAPWNTAAGAVPELILTLYLLVLGVRPDARSREALAV